jgi:hypothetical protein
MILSLKISSISYCSIENKFGVTRKLSTITSYRKQMKRCTRLSTFLYLFDSSRKSILIDRDNWIRSVQRYLLIILNIVIISNLRIKIFQNFLKMYLELMIADYLVIFKGIIL